MKRQWLILGMVFILLTVGAGCHRGEDEPSANSGQEMEKIEESGPSLRSGMSLSEIVDSLAEEYGVALATTLDDERIQSMIAASKESDPSLDLTLSDIIDYSGQFSDSNISSDHILAFEIADGKVSQFRRVLEQRKLQVEKHFENFLNDQFEKARFGKIIEKGNYLFFLMIGDPAEDIQQQVKKAEEKVNSFFS